MNRLRIVWSCCFLLTATVLDAAAETFPRRKSGLWEVTTTVSTAPNGVLTAQTCVDQNSDDLLWEQETGPDAHMTCSKPTFHKEGSDWIAESVCKVETSTVTSRSVFRGSFDSSYRVESTSTYSPPLMGMNETTSVIDVIWLGPCKPGQTPGAILVPEVEEMKKMMRSGAGNP